MNNDNDSIRFAGALRAYLEAHHYEQLNLTHALFDMDGVLFDSMPYHAKAWNRAMADFGLTLSEQEAFLHEGRTGAGTIDIVMQRERGRKATDEEIRAIYARKSEIFNAFAQAGPMPGARTLVEEMKNDGLTAQIVTGSGQKSLLGRIERSYPGLFDSALMVTAFDVRYGKPDPEPYLMGLQKAGIGADHALVVENAPLGVEAGHAAGIFTIAVNTGPLPDEALLDAGADLLFPSMQDFADRWETFFQAVRNTKAEAGQ